MIFIDTNVFLTAIGRVNAHHNTGQQANADELIAQLTIPTISASTSEAVIVETAQMAESAFGGGMGATIAARAMSKIIRLPGLRIAPKHIYLRALDIWADRPGLGFVDALTVAYVEQGDVELASFDQQLLRSPGVTPYWAQVS